MTTVSTVTPQQTAQRAAPQTTTVQDLIPSVATEDLSTFADATPMKTARLGRFVTQETWTEMGTTRSVFWMVATMTTANVEDLMQSAIFQLMTTASTVMGKTV